MMRRIGLIILAWLCVLLVSAQSDTIRVLAIGNSFSQDAIEQYLYELGREVGVRWSSVTVIAEGRALLPTGAM